MKQITEDNETIAIVTPKLPTHIRKTLKRMEKDRVMMQKIWDKPLINNVKASKTKKASKKRAV